MADFSLSEVCKATKGNLIQPGTVAKFCRVITDTRKVQPGDLFIALKGDRFDGHDFTVQAIENGASGIVVSRLQPAIDSRVAVINVSDTLKALQNLAGFHRQRFDIPIVAITGSNGKTTTKDMTASVLESKFNVLKTEANFNNEIGLPQTLLNLNSSHGVGIVEMGMRGLGQIKELTDIAVPTIGVVTNVGETHMELLGSLENIASAKAELIESLPSNGLAILNGDNKYVAAMKKKTNARVLFYGLSDGCDVQGIDIVTSDTNMTIGVKYLDQVVRIPVPTIGKHNVYNALAAIAVGLGLDMSFDEIKQGIKSFTASEMRFSVEKKGNYTVINDAYNASPLSMEAAIDTLAEIAKGRKIAVLGDMLELGSVAVEAHKRIGRKAVENGIEIIITVGEMASYIAQEARDRGAKVAVSCQNHKEAVGILEKYLLPGDTILIKGSRGMAMEKLLNIMS